MERLTSLDICRGLAIACMVAADIPVVTEVGMVKLFSGILAAPFFLFIAGVSYELFVISRIERHKNVTVLNIETFWKAMILLAITQGIFIVGGLVFPSKFSMTFHSSIFFVIASGYLLSIFLPGRLVYQIPMIFLPFLLSHFLDPSMTPVLFTEPFPLVPYISFFFAGRAVMIFYENMHDMHMKNERPVIFSALFIAVMVIIFQVFILPYSGMERTELPGFLLLVGIMIFILSLLSVSRHRVPGYDFFLSPFERIGRIAFSVYYAFYALELVVFPTLNRAFIRNFDPNIQIMAYYLSILIILLLTAGIEKVWRKTGYKYGLEWALRYGSAWFMKQTLKVFPVKV